MWSIFKILNSILYPMFTYRNLDLLGPLGEAALSPVEASSVAALNLNMTGGHLKEMENKIVKMIVKPLFVVNTFKEVLLRKSSVNHELQNMSRKTQYCAREGYISICLHAAVILPFDSAS